MTDSQIIPDDDRALIGEYVLGLLSTEEAAQVEARLRAEPALRELHAAWADELLPMAADRDATPPARVFTALDAKLFPAARARAPWWSGFGWLGLIAGPVAAFALAVFLLQPPAFDPVLHAEMEAVEGSPLPEIHFAAGTDGVDLLILRRTGEALPGRVIELWMIPADGVPRSLGVMPDQDRWVIPAPEGLVSGVVIALSDEPPGGSASGAPTGAILAAGPLYDI